METILNILFSGVFHASTLFLVAAGLQVVFGVQKVFNLACGTLYALGAYFGITVVRVFVDHGFPKPLFILPLIAAGLIIGLVGPLIERGLMRFVYDRDETFQLLLTFGIVMMLEDVIKFVWGTSPQSTGGLDLVYGQLNVLGATVPVYNLIVIACSLLIAGLMGYLIMNTRFGRIVRATADKKEMSEALGINMRSVYIKVFTLGTVLGTLGGALVVPTGAAVSEMGMELIVLAFAVVVIGGLGSMKGAFAGALIVGILKSLAISIYPELEMLTIYVIVIAVLVIKPQGLFGSAGV
ncbi:MAG: branched-chain amino acid ABC transporter permease [Syntrophorhabdales bacterium]|jgi:branched-chain amino acid transport system permease protein